MPYLLSALSLREHLAAPVPAVVVERGEVAVAAVASAWGSWSGLDAEVPAVEAAIETLLERAETRTTLWDSALRDAFHAATHRLDVLPITPSSEALGLYPCTSLVCAVVTPKESWVGWMGGVTACVVRRTQILRETQPHTFFNEATFKGAAKSYGAPIDELILDRYVVEGDPRFLRFPNNAVHTNVVYDIDNVSDGAASFSCGPSDWSGPSENGCPEELEGEEIFFSVPHPNAPELPLRRDMVRADGSYDAVRVPVLRPAGQHGIYNAQPFRVFDADAFMVNFTTRFLGSRGGSVSHEAGCDCSASALPNFTLNGEPLYPALDRACTVEDMRVCEEGCAQRWAIETPTAANCAP